MRKFFVSVICALCVGSAFAAGENVATSKAFVDAGVAQKQEKIPANNGATQVLTNTGTAGQVGTKNIYDVTGTYTEQTDALVTAGQFNTAVQNAIDTEFECVAWNPNDSTDCWLVQIRGVTEDSILPTGYTALEYISTGDTVSYSNPYINSGINLVNGVKFELDVKFNSTEAQFNGTYAQGTRLDISIDSLKFRMNYGATNTTSITADTARHTFIIDTYNLYWAIDNHKESYATTVSVNNNPIYVGGREDVADHLYTHTAENIYSAKIYINDLIVRNFIPARRDSDGVLGMYDTVSNTFFTNAGTGNFIAGPDANNQYLLSGQ